MIHRLLQQQAERSPNAAAIVAPGGAELTYARLYERVTEINGDLNRLGVGRGDRVAMVLPNGPEMAVAFLGVTSSATAAPLNPTYRAEEFAFYLSDLGARALIVARGGESPAVEVAEALGIPVIELRVAAGPEAGAFTLAGRSQGAAASPGFAGPDEVALVLHTSGTTSRPKLVPLTHANLRTSGASVRSALALSALDRCLNIMPLFHIHGLVAGLLASLASGGTAVCTPGFYATQFFDWLEECRPTWYTGVPTMHQSILSRASRHPDAIRRNPLRFIRSSSSALAPQLIGQLEETFGAPVIEAYGMTEAAHQISSTPMPPRIRKPGWVGLPAGPEVAIMDDAGTILPAGLEGEVVIRGPSVMRGYENNAEANRTAFTDGWFRTGDQGCLDGDGYLRLTGRLKEVINRGGEKISPRQVDEVLLDHPAVAQVVTFAVPDSQLGEAVGAAVVLKPGTSTTESALRDFAAARLADFKVPATVVFLDEIPKGPTGKLQRIGLAERLGLSRAAPSTASREYVAPRTPVEELLAGLWAQVLKIERVGIEEHFLDLGGDSMLATLIVSRMRQELGLEISLRSLFDAPTVAHQASVVVELLSGQGVVAAVPAELEPR